ncbi:ATP-dependent RNA helicase CsdA [Nocardioides scoriae]|uniref:ATP-dependent RNA helicase DeaD n=1 Tax=Nocardioides scoriae TaxID=642780 RepID=A0A1H1M5J8_9ACTN|nr:DEAD/DEAH box helicase [Nocardioides scoriae]SDR82068.1 ATP-dependent RNA helicase CsdA [Nocardioides scoriae]
MSESNDGIKFDELGLDPRVEKVLKDVGYESPSAIQAEAIPPLLDGQHVVGLAQTGTGKTAAFALPILSRIDISEASPQVLVLAPTRELALQVSEAFGRYGSHLKGLHVLPVYGGQGYGVQLSALRRGVHVVVGTPGRIMDHLEKGTLDLSGLRFVVLDEADEMLNMGFAEDVETILARTPEGKQLALFSATMPSQIRRIIKRYAPGATEITVKSSQGTATNVKQRYLKVPHPRKVDALTRILEVENFDGMIVFVRTKHATEELAERLRARGFAATALNGDVAQAQRERTIDQLRKGKLDILVATDVAARGLDVERVSHVINYDIPTDTESYVHRIGRTGRAGRSGDAISFVTPRENYLLRSIEKANRTTLEQMQLPTVEDVNAFRVTKFTEAISQALGDSQLGVFRELVETYAAEHDVPVADVAAAVAVLAQDGEPLFIEDMPEPAPERRERRESGSNLVPWKIQVGKRHRVEPRMIVGALANEGGLKRSDFGRIDIKPAFTVVELPADLSQETLAKLADTRISGILIDLQPDRGPRRSGPPRHHDGPPHKKPRHKG